MDRWAGLESIQCHTPFTHTLTASCSLGLSQKICAEDCGRRVEYLKRKLRFFFLCSHCCHHQQQINIDIISKFYVEYFWIDRLKSVRFAAGCSNSVTLQGKRGRRQRINYVLCMKNWVNHRHFHANQPADSVSAKQPAGFATLKIKGFQKDFLNQMLQKSHNVKRWKIKNEGS